VYQERLVGRDVAVDNDEEGTRRLVMSKDDVSELENNKAPFSDAPCDYRNGNRIIAVHKIATLC
jgi:hypothetical protein